MSRFSFIYCYFGIFLFSRGMEMDTTELKAMRKKQMLVINLLFITILMSYFLFINNVNITISTQYLIVSILMLIQIILSLVKGSSTKSFIPIFEQVNIYEKSKMGKEWIKQRKSNRIWSIFLCVLFFFQYFFNLNSNTIMEIDLPFFSGLLILLLILLNTTMLLHIRKVDRGKTEEDFKTYNRKWNIVSIVLGIVFGFAIIMFAIFYALTIG